jgi:hypothetical protein
MYPPVFEIAQANSAVTALLGVSPETRLWPFGYAKQKQSRPYAVWQLVYGNPDNSLSCIPSEDLFGVQIDCYATTVTDARAVASVLQDAFEATYNHVTSYNGENWDQPTGLFRVSFTVEFWAERSS